MRASLTSQATNEVFTFTAEQGFEIYSLKATETKLLITVSKGLDTPVRSRWSRRYGTSQHSALQAEFRGANSFSPIHHLSRGHPLRSRYELRRGSGH